MTDTYLTMGTIAYSSSMTQRVIACAAQQDQSLPDVWASQNRWEWASTPSWAEKWDYAVATHPPVEGEVYDPGADATVITDGDILSRVQQLLETPTQGGNK